MSNEVKTNFLKTVADHRMTIELDHGIHRCVHFGRAGEMINHFRLTTWPGHLCISGDMGTYVFSRLRDMFEFFRDDELRINTGYWAEKCQSESRFVGMTEYSASRFRQIVAERFAEWIDEHPDLSDRVWSEIENQVLIWADDGEDAAHRAARDFESEHGFQFNDFWEHSLREYTYQFKWCLYAIVWGIQQFDAQQPTQRATA